MSYETVLYEVADGVALITLNRPERLNAWNPQLARDLNDALTEADRDDAVRSVVLTGAGRAFCAGADLSAGPDTFDDDSNPERMNRDSNPRILPYDLRKPVIAAINGAAVGVGITYPLLADVRIVAEEAKIQSASWFSSSCGSRSSSLAISPAPRGVTPCPRGRAGVFAREV